MHSDALHTWGELNPTANNRTILNVDRLEINKVKSSKIYDNNEDIPLHSMVKNANRLECLFSADAAMKSA